MRTPGPNPATCQNPSCEYYHQKERKRIIRKGKSRSGRQEYLCLWCGSRFTERTNTPLRGSRLPDDEIHRIFKSALDGSGNRTIERITGHRRETVSRLLSDLAQNPSFLTGYLLASKKFSVSEVREAVRALAGRGAAHAPKAAECTDKAEVHG